MNRKAYHQEQNARALPGLRLGVLTAITLAIGPFLAPAAKADARPAGTIIQASPRVSEEPEEKQPKAREEAGKIILPEVNFEEVTLEDAVKALNEMAAKAAEDKPAPKVEIGKGTDKKTMVKELRLRKAPLWVVLMYCADQAGQPISADEEKLTIGK